MLGPTLHRHSFYNTHNFSILRATNIMNSRKLITALLFLIPATRAQAQMSTFCAAQPNSSGNTTILAGSMGSGVGSGLHLEITDGVPGEFGYILIGSEVTPPVAVSSGLLCLGNSPTARLSRFNHPFNGWSSIGQFDASGVFQNLSGTSLSGSGYDVPGTIPPSIPTVILTGDTWHFQCWHRDSTFAAGASNLSNGLSVTFSGVPVPRMVPIPAGSFQMGALVPGGAPYYGNLNERPLRTVIISQDFWMGETEVTQLQFEFLMGYNPSNYSGYGGSEKPVEYLEWDDARAYCTALTAQEMALGNLPTGFEYRLPTEAEWEYACRAGTTTEFFFGDDLLCADAAFSLILHQNTSCNPNGTEVVGSYAPNAFGLFDMHGNVKEWCLDSFAHYASGVQFDPFVTGGIYRSVRGGSFWSFSFTCRSAYRDSFLPSIHSSTIGFRIVLAPILVP